MAYDIILINGAQGSGKTTHTKLLKEVLDSPSIELDHLRGMHLNEAWSNSNKREAEMAFENMVFMLKNYLKHSYKNVIVTSINPEMIKRFPTLFKNKKFILITLVLNDDEVLKKRVLGERDSGFKDYKESILYNKQLKKQKPLPFEVRIDCTLQTVKETHLEILKIVNG